MHASRKAEQNARGSLDDGVPTSNAEEARTEETSASCWREASGSRGCTACSATSVQGGKPGAPLVPPLCCRSSHRRAPGDTVMRSASATASSTASRVASLVPSLALPPLPPPLVTPLPLPRSVPLGNSAGTATSLASASESITSVRSLTRLTPVRCIPSRASSSARHSPVRVCKKSGCMAKYAGCSPNYHLDIHNIIVILSSLSPSPALPHHHPRQQDSREAEEPALT